MNLQKSDLIDLHQDITQTLQVHISIDILGPYNVTLQGNSYILTAVCSLTGYLMTTPVSDSSKPFIFGHHVKIWLP